MRFRWEVEQLLGERLREELEDVDLAHDADEAAVVVDHGDVPEAAGLHERDRIAHRLLEAERARLGRHVLLDRALEVHAARDIGADEAAEDVTLGEDAGEPTVPASDEHRIAGPRALDRPETGGD